MKWAPGSKARITLTSRVIDEHSRPIKITGNQISISYSSDVAQIIADGVPRLLFGDTDSGLVTCIDSYLTHLPSKLDIASMNRQIWDANTLLIGAHLPEGNLTEVDGVRFILDSPGWWEHLPDTGSAVSEAGEIHCERVEDESVWIEYRPFSALTLREAGNAVMSVMALMKLAVDVDLTLLRKQVRVNGESTWLEVKNNNCYVSNISYPNSGNLLSPHLVTLEKIASWMTIEGKMDGLTSAAANPIKGQPIQAQAMISCSLIEGIHKRIINSKEINYIDRAKSLHEMAQRVDAKITSPVRNWSKVVKKARNDLAHHNTDCTFEVQYRNWIIAEISTTWVLRLCLLVHAGFAIQEIAASLSKHRKYEFYQENLKIIVNEQKFSST